MPQAPKGESHRRWLISEMLFITYEIHVKHRADFPLRVEVLPQAGIGVHFPRRSPVVRFSILRSRIIKLHRREAAIPPPSEPACRRRAEPFEPSEPYEPFLFSPERQRTQPAAVRWPQPAPIGAPLLRPKVAEPSEFEPSGQRPVKLQNLFLLSEPSEPFFPP